jgi:hypothetical protein
MGLDVTHGCWAGSYSLFKVWRSRLAELAQMDEVAIDGRVTEKTAQGVWDFEPADVLDVLLLHSDCDGIIPHRFCAPLADRLSGLVVNDNQEWSAARSEQFIDGLRFAHSDNDDVIFH